MAGGDESVRSLREAVEVSPNNIPLRKHLADTLAAMGRHDEAVQEYRHALALSPRDSGLKALLAKAYFQMGNASAAFSIVEELLKDPACPPATHLLHCRLLLKEGQADRAAGAYRQAVEADASLADAELAARLEVDARTGLIQEQEEFEEVDAEGRVRLGAEGQESPFDLSIERPAIAFEDVGGMSDLKDEIRMKIIHPLAHPELYRAYGKAIGGGILLYGPPGCGKTYLARATAGEVKASFLAVGINDVLDMWLGNSEKNLHALFQTARRNSPCVLFFDEVDALGASRSDMRTSASKQVINQFLGELDGAKNSNEGVLVLGATNAPWHLDSAFRRPGRFDRVLFVPPPDVPARREIIRILLKGKPQADIDLDALAGRTERFSGADLKALVDIAVEAKLKDAMKKGVPMPLTTKDLLTAGKSHKPTTLEWFATARNYALYSNQGGVYDDILAYLKIK